MNEKIVKQWIDKLKKFAKQPSYLHLRFPMFMEGMGGNMYSPEGILCEMHASEGLGKWSPEIDPKDKKMRGYTSYDGSQMVAPESVLKWIGITAATMSEMRRANGENGIDGAISFVEQLIEKNG
jgi:hypothetical protein